MRCGLILLLLGLPGAALAAEDRYGPSRGRDPVVAPNVVSAAGPAVVGRAPSDYRGRLLNWSGKPPGAVQAVAPIPPSPIAAAPPPQVFASRGPDPARLPTSLYDAPAAPSPAAWPQAVTALEPSLPPPPSAPPAAGSPSYAYSPPRAYSVVREWGGTPDRIPSPPRAGSFSGREVALDPNTLGAAQQPDPPPEDEVDEEQPPRKAAKQPAKARK
jgi:hypothetical protein